MKPHPNRPEGSRAAHDVAMAAVTAAVHGDLEDAVAILESSPQEFVTCGSLLAAVLLVLQYDDPEHMEERWQTIATEHMAALEEA